MGTFIDLTGNRFGYLTVDHRVENHNKLVSWLCRCDCGNSKVATTKQLKRGKTISCGCMIGIQHRRDINGMRFGRLVAIEPYGLNKFNKTLWKCKCDCGNETVIKTSALLQGITKSCGCLALDVIKKNIEAREVDLVGARFNKLTVLEKTDQRKSGSVVWKCQCDCGNTVYANTRSLNSNHTQSCGCMKSKNELEIRRFLSENNILFVQNKKFIGCKYRRLLPFDFWLPDYGICIEFDGEQHYKEAGAWDKRSPLEERQRRDDIKTKYCEDNDIILLRIPYWERNNIELILSDWLFLNDGEEASSSTDDLSA